MSSELERIEREARALEPRDRAALARTLLEDLDSLQDEDVEALWIAEAERRYEAYLAGKTKAVPGDEVMARLREKLR